MHAIVTTSPEGFRIRDNFGLPISQFPYAYTKRHRANQAAKRANLVIAAAIRAAKTVGRSHPAYSASTRAPKKK